MHAQPWSGGPATGFLPEPLSEMVDRERELADLVALLRRPEVRLLTLTGPGGVGKTRLALRVAADARGDFVDGVVWIPLASLADPGLLLRSVGERLGVRDVEDGRYLERQQVFLREKAMLLVLDNLEHIVEATPPLVDLLEAAPKSKVLATSRIALRLVGEHVFPILPLALPEETRRPTATEVFCPAVQLFVVRARAAVPAFGMTDGNAGDIAAICRRLDGLPLAIELAAAWSGALPPATLASRLTDRLPMLGHGVRGRPARHQTMRNAIAWSHDLLSDEERMLFRRLSVFAGGFAVDAADAVCGETTVDGRQTTGETTAVDRRLSTVDSVLEGIASLVAKSLVDRLDDGDQPRYRMLETIREFGREQLVSAGEEEEIRRRHATWWASVVLEAESGLWGGRQREWLERLESDLDNLRLALDWWTSVGDSGEGLRLTASLVRFWCLRPVHLAEGRERLERSLAYGHAAPAAAQARAMVGAGAIAKCFVSE